MTNEEHDETRQDDADEELDEILDQLGEVERSRKTKTAIIALVALVVIGGATVWMVLNTEALFRPDVDYEGGELELLVEPTDPVCRSMESEVYGLADDFEEYDLIFEEEILGDDEETIDELREVARSFRSRFDQLASQIDDAVFNERAAREAGHPPVVEQLEDWFGFMDNDFRILEEMADRQLRQLRGEEVEERGYKWETPVELRDEVLMNIDELFEKFRVWVQRGAHFCGEAPEGVEPWQG